MTTRDRLARPIPSEVASGRSPLSSWRAASTASLTATSSLERLGVALADGTRRRILSRLLLGPAYPADLAEAVGTSRSNVSNHLTCLRGCGIVTGTAEGRHVRYELVDEAVGTHLQALATLLRPSEPDHPHLQ